MHTAESSRELAWIRARLGGRLPMAEASAIIATNLQGLVAYWSRGAERLYGWTEAEALGRDILDLTPAKYTREQSAQIMAALQAGRTWQGEILLQHRDGAPMLAYVLDIPVGEIATGQGAIIGVSAPAEARAAIQRQTGRLCDDFRRRFDPQPEREQPDEAVRKGR